MLQDGSHPGRRALDGASAEPLEMWGGIECTVNRVGELYLDQLERGGHGDEGELVRLAVSHFEIVRPPRERRGRHIDRHDLR